MFNISITNVPVENFMFKQCLNALLAKSEEKALCSLILKQIA